MGQHKATIAWRRTSSDFSYESYNRDHEWRFENDQRIAASAAPAFRGSPGRIDPEEAFVASVSACHMLTFLAICARRRIVVEEYLDHAVGYLENNAAGRLAVTRVELSPRIRFSGKSPSTEQLQWLHHQSHSECFIANSVKTEIVVLANED